MKWVVCPQVTSIIPKIFAEEYCEIKLLSLLRFGFCAAINVTILSSHALNTYSMLCPRGCSVLWLGY